MLLAQAVRGSKRAGAPRRGGEMTNGARRDLPLPGPPWDAVLRLAPAHLFWFDPELVCRYAAPTRDVFLGRPREDLIGRTASEILPPPSEPLHELLAQAAQASVPSRVRHYPYRHPTWDPETTHRWSVEVQPVSAERHRG